MTRSLTYLLALVAGCSSYPIVDPDDPNERIRAANVGELHCRSLARPYSKILLTSRADVPVSAFECTAIGEDIRLKTVLVSNCLKQDPDIELCNDPHAIPGDDHVVDYPTGLTLHVDGNRHHAAPLTNNQSYTVGIGATIPKNGRKRFYFAADIATEFDTFSGSLLQLNLETGPITTFGLGLQSGEIIQLHRGVVTRPHVVRTTKPTVDTAPWSPYGYGFSPIIQEVFAFHVAADTGGNVPMHKITFRMDSTDTDSRGWNSCADLADPVRWNLYFSDDLANPIHLDWRFYDSAGIECVANPSKALRYAEATISETILAGEIETMSLYVNPFGAGPSDKIRFGIPAHSQMPDPLTPIVWDDDSYATGIDGEFIKKLPAFPPDYIHF